MLTPLPVGVHTTKMRGEHAVPPTVGPTANTPLVLSISDTARHLGLIRRNGEPNRRAVQNLIREGKLRQVDDTQPIQRWTVAYAEVVRYVNEGPRKVAS